MQFERGINVTSRLFHQRWNVLSIRIAKSISLFLDWSQWLSIEINHLQTFYSTVFRCKYPSVDAFARLRSFAYSILNVENVIILLLISYRRKILKFKASKFNNCVFETHHHVEACQIKTGDLTIHVVNDTSRCIHLVVCNYKWDFLRIINRFNSILVKLCLLSIKNFALTDEELACHFILNMKSKYVVFRCILCRILNLWAAGVLMLSLCFHLFEKESFLKIEIHFWVLLTLWRHHKSTPSMRAVHLV